ncbi:MAG: hypothetical protein HXY49_08880 [Ignavibacteriaceae bacterium]|nr:hypothetical protein [Ignavibacteriaceae bacterium]
MKKILRYGFQFLLLGILSSPSFLLVGCSTANYDYLSDSIPDDAVSVSFKTYEDGEKILWQAIIQDGQIIKLLKNEKQIPDNEIDNYEHMVFGKLNNNRFHFRIYGFDPDMREIPGIPFDERYFEKKFAPPFPFEENKKWKEHFKRLEEYLRKWREQNPDKFFDPFEFREWFRKKEFEEIFNPDVIIRNHIYFVS